MAEEQKANQQDIKLPDPPEWIKEFRQRTMIIDVIEKAFDPKVSDKEVREMLIKAAQALKDLGIPSNQ